MIPSLAEAVSASFSADKRVSVKAIDSQMFLSLVCDLIPKDEPILFWLDAHFPGADYGLKGYGGEQDKSLRLPLRHEIDIIVEGRPEGKDIILVDDLRIWVDGAFGSGNLPDNVRPFCPRNRDASFFREVFDLTHDVRFDYANEGYVVVTPKGTANAV